MGIELTILVLLIIGITFMVLEAITPSFGLFGLGGAASFIAALMMMRDLETFYGIAVDVPLLVGLGLIGIAVLAGSFYFVRVAWRQKITAGSEILPGMSARVIEWAGDSGRVAVDGERWAATGPTGLSAGDLVTVRARNHLTLTVTKD